METASFSSQFQGYSQASQARYYQLQSLNDSHSRSNHEEVPSTLAKKCCSFGVGEGPTKNSLYICDLPLFGGTPLHIHYFWPILVCVMTLSGASISFIYSLFAFTMSCPILFGR
jgi:hypothetical protein